jgi:hypothetical protein
MLRCAYVAPQNMACGFVGSIMACGFVDSVWCGAASLLVQHSVSEITVCSGRVRTVYAAAAGCWSADVHPALCDRLLTRVAAGQQHVPGGRSYGTRLRSRCADSVQHCCHGSGRRQQLPQNAVRPATGRSSRGPRCVQRNAPKGADMRPATVPMQPTSAQHGLTYRYVCPARVCCCYLFPQTPSAS